MGRAEPSGEVKVYELHELKMFDMNPQRWRSTS